MLKSSWLQLVQLANFDWGFNQPLVEFTRLRFLLRGVRRSQENRQLRRVRAPVSLAGLYQVLTHVSRSLSPFDSYMVSAALLTAFFGMLRASEYTAPSAHAFSARATLQVADVELNWTRRMVLVSVRISKTDPFMAGAVVRIPAISGCFCPFLALAAYLRVRGNSRGPLFRILDGSFLARSAVSRSTPGAASACYFISFT